MESYVCKVIVLGKKESRFLKPRKLDDNIDKFVRSSPLKGCLFGVPDLCETNQLLEDQFQLERQMFRERFGFDLTEIENLERQSNIENVDTNSESQLANKKTKNSLKARRRNKRSLKSQVIMTDFYKARKNVQLLEDYPKAVPESVSK